jgi:hypothetical protein
VGVIAGGDEFIESLHERGWHREDKGRAWRERGAASPANNSLLWGGEDISGGFWIVQVMHLAALPLPGSALGVHLSCFVVAHT